MNRDRCPECGECAAWVVYDWSNGATTAECMNCDEFRQEPPSPTSNNDR